MSQFLGRLLSCFRAFGSCDTKLTYPLLLLPFGKIAWLTKLCFKVVLVVVGSWNLGGELLNSVVEHGGNSFVHTTALIATQLQPCKVDAA